MMAKYLSSGLFLIFLLGGVALANGIEKADRLFNKGMFQGALEQYELIFEKATNNDIRWKAFFRICESLAHLYRYGEAAQRLISTPLPKEVPYRARILILKAEIFRNFLLQYSSFQRGDIIDEEGKEQDVFRLTPEEIRKEIRETYKQLWGLRKELINSDLKKEGYFTQIKNIDFGMYPTMFDYLILSWTDFLLNTEASYVSEDTKTPEAELLLVEEFKRAVNFKDPPALLAAELMEEASHTDGESRSEAQERWKIKRLLLPLKRGGFIVKDYASYNNKAKGILLKWMDSFKTNEAKAEAGYEVAVVLSTNEKFPEAVTLCETIEKRFSKTYASQRAKELRLRIQMPQLTLLAKTVMPPAREAFALTIKNLKKVYFRIYRLDPYKVKYEYNQLSKDYSYDRWSDILNSPNEEWLKKFLPKQNLYIYRAWNVETGDKSDYKTIITKIIDPPELEAGFYLVLCCADNSFKIGSSLMQACFLNVTDLVLVGTAGFTTKANDAYYDFIGNKGPDDINDDAFRFYTLNAKTGKPLQGVDLDIYINSNHREGFFEGRSTDKKGVASLSQLVEVSPHGYNWYSVNPLAKAGKSFAFWSSDNNLNYSPPSPIQLFLETDRPIYRPGHKVQAKVVVLRRIPEGFKTLGNKEVIFSARDPNYKEFFTETVKLNEFGSASISFEIPQGRLLGRYELSVACTDGRFSNSTGIGFSVEEYKRPEFEILLKPADAPWKYKKSVEIKGEARYYFGGPVPDAPIKYHIKRQTYIPWYYRCWFSQGYYSGGGEEIEAGELKTDAEGNFVIPFTPTPPPQGTYWGSIPDISQFIVEVEGRDSGGRTIEAQQPYRAGKNGIYFVIEPKRGFFLEKEKIEIESKRLTINDTPAQGKGTYEVFRLSNTPTKPLTEIESYYEYGGGWGWIPPLDVQLKDVPNDKSVAKGAIEHDKDGKIIIKLASLPQGAYRIRERSKDQWGGEVTQDKIFVVAKNTKEAVPVNAPSVMLVEKDEYKIGEKARFIIGSGLGSGIYHVEIWAGQHLLRTELIVADARQGKGNQPVRLIEVPIKERLKGGFTLRWFGAKGLDVHYGQATVSVPWVEKRLEVALEPFKKELKPGEEVKWGVKIKDLKGSAQNAEVLALMYDRSLEYYITSQNPWLDNLYALRPRPVSGCDSVFNPYVITFPITEGLLAKILGAFGQPTEAPVPPGLRTWRTWVEDTTVFKEKMKIGKGDITLDEAVAEPSFAIKKLGEEADEREKAPEKKIEARKAFADTAFFKPHIVTGKDGKGKFTFTAPEQLTSWRIRIFSFTKDVKEGRLTEEAVTKKELMVRVDIPRFFREKDRGTVTAIVHNESGKTLKGELSINITENDKSINQKLKLKDNKKQFVVKPHSLESFDWMIEIPEGVSTYRVRAVAIADKLSDAEERELPILPSRQRLIESVFAALSGSESKKLEIALKDDPTRINESMILQVDPQLALSILNTIPFLVEYPFDCVEQILNRYVPLSIVNEIYKKYPAIKEAVGKIPERKTVTPPWEKDDPRRLITLMETPWVWQSEGRPTIWPIIDLLDPDIVKAQKDITFDKLKSAQLSDGAFPWWPGGRADPYMTLYVLAGLAEARRYGVDMPEDMIQSALMYVNKEIPLQLKAEARFLSLVSYASYVVTSFSPEEFSEAKKGHEAAESWIKFLEKHIHALTPFGKAYLSYTYLRLGNKERAKEILDMAMDGVREDPIAGVYWTPEKYSWVWYSDTVEKHAFLLRTLQELRPKDERIPGMVQWLLFNRKGTVWKSTKASVAAVYALLDFLNKRGALGADETFNIQWGKDKYSVVVKADDWLDEPIRWQEKGFEITPEKTKATVDKKGPGLAFASLTWTYSTDQIPEASTPGMLTIKRKFYRRVKEGKKYHLKPIKSGERVSVGDQIEVQIKINTRSQFEYMHLKDPKVSGFEAETLLSGWKYDPLWFYEEPRDSLTNFFMDWLPHGEYILRYRLRPTKPGVYRVGAAILQSMYAPEMTAHSAGFIVIVK